MSPLAVRLADVTRAAPGGAQTAGTVQAAEDVRLPMQEALHIAAHLGVVRCDERAHALKHGTARRRKPREVTLAAQRADGLPKPIPDRRSTQPSRSTLRQRETAPIRSLTDVSCSCAACASASSPSRPM